MVLLIDKKYTTPEEFEGYVAPVAGETTIKPYRGSQLRGTLRATKLAKIGFLNIDSSPIHASNRNTNSMD